MQHSTDVLLDVIVLLLTWWLVFLDALTAIPNTVAIAIASTNLRRPCPPARASCPAGYTATAVPYFATVDADATALCANPGPAAAAIAPFGNTLTFGVAILAATARLNGSDATPAIGPAETPIAVAVTFGAAICVATAVLQKNTLAAYQLIVLATA